MYLYKFLYKKIIFIFSISIIILKTTMLYCMEAPESEGKIFLSYAVASSIGGPTRRCSEMEDAYVILCPLNEDEPQISFFGVFDGNGGNCVSQKAVHEIPKLVNMSGRSPAEKLCYSLKNFNRYLEVWHYDLAEDCGSTAIIALLNGNKLWVANLGNSRAILYSNGDITPLSKDHNLRNIEERQRVEKINCKNRKLGRKSIRILKDGKYECHLSISRSLGNFYYSNYGLIDDAEIEEAVLKSGDFFILASDGIFEDKRHSSAFSIEDVMHFIAESLKANDNNTQIAAQALVNKAIANGSRDNLTVIVVSAYDQSSTNKLEVQSIY